MSKDASSKHFLSDKGLYVRYDKIPPFRKQREEVYSEIEKREFIIRNKALIEKRRRATFIKVILWICFIPVLFIIPGIIVFLLAYLMQFYELNKIDSYSSTMLGIGIAAIFILQAYSFNEWLNKRY
jgi:hypothetical protein